MPRERVFRIIERKIQRAGRTVTLIYARTSYKGRDGKRHTLWRKGDTRTEAKENVKAALEEIQARGEQNVKRSHATFADYAAYYKKTYLVPAKYKGDSKIEGLRSYQKVASQLKPLIAFFGGMELRDITHTDISLYRTRRLTTPYERGKDAKGKPKLHERSVASVNRELALLRTMLKRAVSGRWLVVNPFQEGDSLISTADEVERQRTLTREEEERIFLACDADSRRAHLKPILICLIDTGMRRNEVFRLTWQDVDFDTGIIRAVSFKGKQRMERPVAMTVRLRAVLFQLEAIANSPADRVFGVIGDIKRSWTTVRKLAGLEDVRLHDLRHEAATTFIKSGVSLEETGKLLGHRQPKTTWRYLNPGAGEAIEAAQAVDAHRAKEEEKDIVN